MNALDAPPQTPAKAPEDSLEARLAEVDPRDRLALFVLEDFAATTLLRMGRALGHTDLANEAQGFSLTRAALRDLMNLQRRIVPLDRTYDLALRLRRKGLPREERARQPLESAIDELLREIGKPLPVPVIAREVALIRGVLPETVREACANILRSARSAVETAPQTYLHRSFVLDAGAPREELIIRENALEQDPDFEWVSELPPPSGDTLAARAVSILEAAESPLTHKLLGFLLWKSDPQGFDMAQFGRIIGDRATFYCFIDGLVTLQKQMPLWRSVVQDWVGSISGAAVDNLDVAALLRRGAAQGSEAVTPNEHELNEMKNFARGSQALLVTSAVVDVMEIEPEDARFVPTVQALNESLRRDTEFLPVGIGRYLLRALVPKNVGQVPQELRPVLLSVAGSDGEPLDFEMSDDGLEGDCADFVHAPEWEDINEEVEVRMPRRAGDEHLSAMRYVLLNHHKRAQTIKLRRMDEEFFEISGGLSRIIMIAEHEGEAQEVTAWASRDSGLIYGLSDYLDERTSPSGARLEFARPHPGGPLQLKLGEEKAALISPERYAELEPLRASAAYLSLFELMQSVMSAHAGGMELLTVWAEINAVRRTGKRLLCSVLSGYNCFAFKQRGPKQILWRFDESKLDQGFKRNKRKFVRR